MTGEAWGVAAAVLGAIVTLFSFVWVVRRAAKEDAQRRTTELAEVEGRAFSRGSASRDDEVRMLTSDLAQARSERDQALHDRDYYRGRYDSLRENRGEPA